MSEVPATLTARLLALSGPVGTTATTAASGSAPTKKKRTNNTLSAKWVLSVSRGLEPTLTHPIHRTSIQEPFLDRPLQDTRPGFKRRVQGPLGRSVIREPEGLYPLHCMPPRNLHHTLIGMGGEITSGPQCKEGSREWVCMRAAAGTVAAASLTVQYYLFQFVFADIRSH